MGRGSPRARARARRPWLLAVSVVLGLTLVVAANWQWLACRSEPAWAGDLCVSVQHEHRVQPIAWLPGPDVLPCDTCELFR